MGFDTLPGPTLPELARTALARAAVATVRDAERTGSLAAAQPVPVRARRDGTPLLLPATGSLPEELLRGRPGPVTVSVPARMPFRVLRLTGTARLTACEAAVGITAYEVALRRVEFSGADRVRVPLAEYRAAAPDPLWQLETGVVNHLEHGHMADLVGCVRAHGMARAEWVIPRGLDRYGLELLVLTPDGAAAVRLSFPDGPVDSIGDIPASIRTAMTCRCQAGPDAASRRGGNW